MTEPTSSEIPPFRVRDILRHLWALDRDQRRTVVSLYIGHTIARAIGAMADPLMVAWMRASIAHPSTKQQDRDSRHYSESARCL